MDPAILCRYQYDQHEIQDIHISNFPEDLISSIMVRICAIFGCGNSTKHIDKWLAQLCEVHGLMFGSCVCKPPFSLFPFPSEKKHPERRQAWVKLVNRKGTDGKNWKPQTYARICSKHFRDGEPTELNPDPTKLLGYDLVSTSSKGKLPRKPPLKRGSRSTSEKLEKAKRQKGDCPEAKVPIPAQTETEDHQPEYTPAVDHSYGFLENNCTSCKSKHDQISKLKVRLNHLRTQSKATSKCSSRSYFSICNIVLKSDASVNSYTGIQSRDKFIAFHNFLLPKVAKMRYWYGCKKSSPRNTPRGKRTPMKRGPARNLTAKEELILVLMKLKMSLTMAFLASLFFVSVGTASNIFTTWIKFLAFELKPLILWPDKVQVLTSMPLSLKKKYPNLRCTLDCSEIFIERPRNLELQALTWSDYKHHNTVKYMVAIAPNGMISFLSKAWGGRTSDVHITKESGFLNLIDPHDLILADRGFTIKEELLLKQACLEIPPPGKGKEQQAPEEVARTKKIANARIHVERAIGRMKWFRILKDTLPITLIPLIDDITTVCAALVNLRSPLVSL